MRQNSRENQEIQSKHVLPKCRHQNGHLKPQEIEAISRRTLLNPITVRKMTLTDAHSVLYGHLRSIHQSATTHSWP